MSIFQWLGQMRLALVDALDALVDRLEPKFPCGGCGDVDCDDCRTEWHRA